MMTPRSGAWALLSISVLLTAACASNDGSSAGIDGVAAGSIRDSLSACMGRIPSDATSGQRMLAEQSCERDQASRKK